MICLCKKRRQLFFFYLFLFLELLNKFKNKFHQINYSYLIILAEIVKKKFMQENGDDSYKIFHKNNICFRRLLNVDVFKKSKQFN